jgi:hypothetical protein
MCLISSDVELYRAIDDLRRRALQDRHGATVAGGVAGESALHDAHGAREWIAAQEQRAAWKSRRVVLHDGVVQGKIAVNLRRITKTVDKTSCTSCARARTSTNTAPALETAELFAKVHRDATTTASKTLIAPPELALLAAASREITIVT